MRFGIAEGINSALSEISLVCLTGVSWICSDGLFVLKQLNFLSIGHTLRNLSWFTFSTFDVKTVPGFSFNLLKTSLWIALIFVTFNSFHREKEREEEEG